MKHNTVKYLEIDTTTLAAFLVLSLVVNTLALLVGVNMGEQEAIFAKQLERKARIDQMRLQIESVNPQAPSTEIANAIEASCQGVPSELVLAVIWQESHFKPDAIGKAGEVGLMQLNPKWHNAPADIAGNVAVGCELLRGHLSRYTLSRTLLAYNGLGGDGEYVRMVSAKMERIKHDAI